MNSKDNRTMMDDNLKQQRERLKTVMEYLRTLGYSQKDVIDKMCNCCEEGDELYDYCSKLDEPTLSGYKSGKIKYIPEKLLQALHKCYSINPEYIRLQSELMLDTLGEYYKYFEKLVKSWRVEECEQRDPKGNNYTVKQIYLKIDKNFFDFLFDVKKASLFDEIGVGSSTAEIENLKRLYLSKPNIQEYVLSPVETHFKIIEDQKYVDNMVVDLLKILQSDSD